MNHTITRRPIKQLLILALLSYTFFFSVTQLTAQLPCEDLPLPKEQVTLHLDRNICLAGETIWFKAWCFLNGQLDQEMSKVLYIEIFDETQKVIVQEKYLLNDNKTAGAIRIPEDVPSKYYFLKAYTRYMRNFLSTDYHYQQLIIVNPLIEGGKIAVKASTSNKSQIKTPTQQHLRSAAEKRLEIEVDKEKYQPREQINFRINSLESITAELSVAVRLKGLGNQPAQKVMLQNKWLRASCQEDPFCRQFYPTAGSYMNSSDSLAQNNTLPTKSKQLRWLPETRGLTISGVVQNDQQENIAGALTTVAVLQETPLLYMGTTDESGVFTICLQQMQQPKELFVGTPNEKHSVLIQNDFDPHPPEITAVPLEYDSTQHNLLASLNLHQQLTQIYPKNESQAVFQSNPLHIPSINILAPDHRIALNDFIQLQTMSEVFRAVTSSIVPRKRKGKEILSVFNHDQQKWYDSPLILLDNVPVFNISELLKIDPANIEAIEVYDSDYILGDYTIEAMVSISSKTNNFAAYKWGEQVAFTTFKSFAPAQAFEQILHLEKSHYPDFRPVLYWQPNLLFQQQVSEPISIFAPDRPGIYEILVQGFTNSGAACFGYVTFEVIQDL